ncbi:MAG: S-layer homology domain-containing protein, partial [Bacillota bacterium]|nr:S-layer homology domain-containing protein [Bacillota bacterium]
GEAGPVPGTQSVLEGETADEPEEPTWPGRTFQYWEEQEVENGALIFGPGFNFNTPIYHDTHLKAIWEENDEVTVYFNPDNGDAIFTETLLSGQAVDKPVPNPEKDGYEFKYWDYDYSVTEMPVYTGYNFELPVEYDLYLIAIYDKIPEYIVNFDADEGSPVPSSQTVLEGTKATEPTDPSKSGYTFSHWKEIECDEEEYYYDEYVVETSLQDPFDFDTLISNDTCLLAVYDENEVTPRKTYSPNAVKDYLATDMNVPVKVKTSVLMSNDSHANNFVSVQRPSNGTVKLSGSTVTFTPDVDFAGSAKFYYTIEYKGKEDEGLVVVQVNAVIIEDETPLGASNRYIIGDEKGNFRSFSPLTRAELATMYARLLSLNYQAKTIPQYTDVISTSWYAPFINILKQTEILVGYADDTFNPDGLITRAELASSIARYYEFVGESFTPTPSGFTDIEGHPAQSDIEIVAAQEMMSAYTGTSFMPDRLITRVETIKVLNKLFGIQPRIPQKPSFNDINNKSFGFSDIEAATEDTIFTAK